MLAHRGKQFSLFDRINTQVGFHIQVQLQHIFRVAGFFGYHRDHFFGYGRFIQRGGFRGRGDGSRSGCSRNHNRRAHGRGRSRRNRRRSNRGWDIPARVREYKFNAVADSRIVF